MAEVTREDRHRGPGEVHARPDGDGVRLQASMPPGLTNADGEPVLHVALVFSRERAAELALELLKAAGG